MLLPATCLLWRLTDSIPGRSGGSIPTNLGYVSRVHGAFRSVSEYLCQARIHRDAPHGEWWSFDRYGAHARMVRPLGACIWKVRRRTNERIVLQCVSATNKTHIPLSNVGLSIWTTRYVGGGSRFLKQRFHPRVVVVDWANSAAFRLL